jgi:hypothetical protein
MSTLTANQRDINIKEKARVRAVKESQREKQKAKAYANLQSKGVPITPKNVAIETQKIAEKENTGNTYLKDNKTMIIGIIAVVVIILYVFRKKIF